MADGRCTVKRDLGKDASQDTGDADQQSGNNENDQGTQQGSGASVGQQLRVKKEGEGASDKFQPPSACFICVMQGREEQCDYDSGGKTPCTYCSTALDKNGNPLRCTRPGKARRQGVKPNGHIDPRDIQPNGAGRGRGRGGGVRGSGDFRGGHGGAPAPTSPAHGNEAFKDREERYRLLDENNKLREKYERVQEKNEHHQEEIKKLHNQLAQLGEGNTKLREENIRMQAQLELLTSGQFKPILKHDRDADEDENIRGAKRFRDTQAYDQPASTFESPRGYSDANQTQHPVFAPHISEQSRRQHPSWLRNSAIPSPTPAPPGDYLSLPPRDSSLPDGRLSASPAMWSNMNVNAQHQRGGETLANVYAHASGSVNTGWLPHPWAQPWDGRDYRLGYGDRGQGSAVNHRSFEFQHGGYLQGAEQFQHARNTQNSTAPDTGWPTSQPGESQYGEHYDQRRSHDNSNVNPPAGDHHGSAAAQSEAWGNYYRTEDDHNAPASQDGEEFEPASRSSEDRSRGRGYPRGPMR